LSPNRLHDTDQRFARWLPEVRDRVQSNEFPLTHGFMAEMLGIRRASVTDAATKLKKLEVIAIQARQNPNQALTRFGKNIFANPIGSPPNRIPPACDQGRIKDDYRVRS
jgi:hypothetical protein